MAAHLRNLLAEDPRTHELDIEIDCADDRILLRGEVPSAERREVIEKIAQECLPGSRIENQIRVASYNEPTEAEALK